MLLSKQTIFCATIAFPFVFSQFFQVENDIFIITDVTSIFRARMMLHKQGSKLMVTR